MEPRRQNDEFATTQWSIVISSRVQDSTVRHASLTELCEKYWYPLFAFLRRKGHSPDEAADYVQSFFVELIDKDFLKSVEPEKGRFRWFLMSAVKRFVGKQIEKQRAQKRGGDRKIFSVDLANAEQRYQTEPIDGWSAEKLFDRRWAMTVLEEALEILRADHEARGKLELYQQLQPTLAGITMNADQYQAIGETLNLSAGAVKVAALRLRQKYRDAIQGIVAQTVSESDEVDSELDALLTALRG